MGRNMRMVAVMLACASLIMVSTGCTLFDTYKEQELRSLLAGYGDLADPQSVEIRSLEYLQGDQMAGSSGAHSEHWDGEIRSKNSLGVYKRWEKFSVSISRQNSLEPDLLIIKIGEDIILKRIDR